MMCVPSDGAPHRRGETSTKEKRALGSFFIDLFDSTSA